MNWSKVQVEQSLDVGTDPQQAHGHSTLDHRFEHSLKKGRPLAVGAGVGRGWDYPRPSSPDHVENESVSPSARQIILFRRVAGPETARLVQHLGMAELTSGEASPAKTGSSSVAASRPSSADFSTSLV